MAGDRDARKLAETLAAHAAWVESGGREGRRADLAGANLRGRSLANTVLARANLAGADLRETDLGWADLREADLAGADLRGATLAQTMRYNPIDLPRGQYRVDLTGARLDGANVAGLDLRGTGAPGTGPWIGPNDAEQRMDPPPLPTLVAPEAPAPGPAAPPGKPGKPRKPRTPRKKRMTAETVPGTAETVPAPPVTAAPAAAATLLRATLPGRAGGIDGAWRLALAIARALDPAWPAAPQLVAKSEDVDWKEGVTRTYADGPGPRSIHVRHWTATDPHLRGGADAEEIGAAVHGLAAGRPSVTVVPGRRSWEGDLVAVDLASLEEDRRPEARAAAEAFLGVPLAG